MEFHKFFKLFIVLLKNLLNCKHYRFSEIEDIQSKLKKVVSQKVHYIHSSLSLTLLLIKYEKSLIIYQNLNSFLG